MSLNWGRRQWEALAIRWTTDRVGPEERAELWDQMSRAEKRRFQRLCEDVEAKKIHSADSFVTRRELMGIVAIAFEQKVMPIAANVDRNDQRLAALELPLWARFWSRLKGVWARARSWLHRRGVRLVRLTTEGDIDAEGPGDGDGEARGEKPQAADGSVAQTGGHAAGDRVPRRAGRGRAPEVGLGNEGGGRGRGQAGGEKASPEESGAQEEMTVH